MHNPALRQESRYEPASVIPLKQEYSLIEWLESNNRLIPRETLEKQKLTSDSEELELIDSEEHDYDEDEVDVEDIEE